MKKSISLFLLFLMIPTLAFGGEFPEPKCSHDRELYEQTLYLCQHFEEFKGYISMVWSIAEQSYKNTTLGNLITINPKLRELQENVWFWEATNRCFGTNDYLKRRFVTALTLSDALGKQPAFARIVLNAVAFRRGPQIISAGLGLIKSSAGIFAFRATIIGGISAMGYKGFERYIQTKKRIDDILESPDPNWLMLVKKPAPPPPEQICQP